jgi:carbon-monoxide dehydrogenase small subunit
MEKIKVNFILNDCPVTVETYPNKRLVDLLRDDCGCTSVNEGCGEGECGACTVLRNDEPIASCLMLAGQVEGDRILTLEGLSLNGELDKLQTSFIEAGAVQCGFCTPGMILAAKALLIKKPHPNTEEIKKAISGNLCRCTGYAKIIKAVAMAAE